MVFDRGLGNIYGPYSQRSYLNNNELLEDGENKVNTYGKIFICINFGSSKYYKFSSNFNVTRSN